MKLNYKVLYERTKMQLDIYQDEIVPGLHKQILRLTKELEKERERKHER